MITVTKDQIRAGALNFVQSEVINKLQLSPNLIQYGLVTAGINLWVSHTVDTLLADTNTAQSFGLIDENGHYYIGMLADEFKRTMPDTGYRIELKALGMNFGTMTLHRADVDSLVSYIANA